MGTSRNGKFDQFVEKLRWGVALNDPGDLAKNLIHWYGVKCCIRRKSLHKKDVKLGEEIKYFYYIRIRQQ